MTIHSFCKKSLGVSFATVFATLGLVGAATAATTPTVSELLNASNAEYLIDAVPAGMHAFINDGTPVMFVDNANGVVSSVFVTAEDQIIIAFQGTTGGFTDSSSKCRRSALAVSPARRAGA